MPNYSGQSIGRYHVIEQLGSGGMATVYKAFDTRLERYVAIKFIRKEAVQDATFLKRFEREAKALAILSHPNIVKIMDFGEYQGTPYLVMEYIPGGTMKRLLGTPMPWREAANLLIPITDALEYTHQHGIIHRDVKPSNFLLSDSGVPMLSDFGIAKMIEHTATVQLTAVGVGLGTPEYMAPEQGQGAVVDRRADIYALGIVLYELVTGKKPFRADTPMAVVFKHMSSPLPDPRLYVPDLPEGLIQIIFKALAKKPEDRFQTMAEFGKALERLLQEKPPVVPTRSPAAEVATQIGVPVSTSTAEIPPVQYNYPVKAQNVMPAPTATPSAPVSSLPPVQYNMPVQAQTSYPAYPSSVTEEAPPQKKSKWMIGVLIPLVIIACILVVVLGVILYSLWNQRNAVAMENATATYAAQTAEERRHATGTARSERNTQEALNEQATQTALSITQTAAAQQAYATQTAQALTLTAQAINQTATAQAQQQGSGGNQSGWVVILDDPFNTSANWEIGSETNDWWTGSTSIQNGILTWDATSLQGFVDYLTPTNGYQRNFKLFVRGRQVSGPQDSAYGAYFRNNDANDQYYFSINSNTQSASLWVLVNTTWTNLFTVTSLNIHTTGSGLYNEFIIIANDNQFSFYINDDQNPIKVVQDSTLPGEGWLGLAIEITGPGNRAVYQFDQFQLSIP